MNWWKRRWCPTQLPRQVFNTGHPPKYTNNPVLFKPAQLAGSWSDIYLHMKIFIWKRKISTGVTTRSHGDNVTIIHFFAPEMELDILYQYHHGDTMAKIWHNHLPFWSYLRASLTTTMLPWWRSSKHAAAGERHRVMHSLLYASMGYQLLVPRAFPSLHPVFPPPLCWVIMQIALQSKTWCFCEFLHRLTSPVLSQSIAGTRRSLNNAPTMRMY